jgi:pyruvate,water dikinase
MIGDRWTELDDDKADAAELRGERPELTTVTDEQLLARARDVQARLPHLFSQHVVPGTSAAVAAGLLAVVAEAVGEPGLPMTLFSTLGAVDSADAGYALWDLSRIVSADPELWAAFDRGVDRPLQDIDSPRFERAWEDFLYEFGSSGPDEWDLRAPTWETHPQLARAARERLRLQSDDESPQVRAEPLAVERDRLLASARERLADDPETLGLLDAGLVAGRVWSRGG